MSKSPVDGDAGAARFEASSGSRLGDLYAAHSGEATRLAFLLTGDAELAGDLVQDAFLRLFRRFRDLRSPDSFVFYLRRTIVNLSRDHFRRRRLERDHAARERVAVQDPPGFEIESRDELWRGLQALPTRQRAALVLRYYADMSERDTADSLDCSVGAVKSLINRALNQLRTEIKGERDG